MPIYKSLYARGLCPGRPQVFAMIMQASAATSISYSFEAGLVPVYPERQKIFTSCCSQQIHRALNVDLAQTIGTAWLAGCGDCTQI